MKQDNNFKDSGQKSNQAAKYQAFGEWKMVFWQASFQTDNSIIIKIWPFNTVRHFVDVDGI